MFLGRKKSGSEGCFNGDTGDFQGIIMGASRGQTCFKEVLRVYQRCLILCFKDV